MLLAMKTGTGSEVVHPINCN